jgi:uncharacterized protein (DUF488 family)
VTASAVEVLTIGHSTLPYERFVALLRQASVTAVADVRTAPYSRHFPQFNRDRLRDELRRDKIAYVFLGDQLGGRPKDKKLFRDGAADYEAMVRTANFEKGLERVIDGAKKFRIAMMCSEHDPLDCHRCLMVGRVLHECGVVVGHILSDGSIISHAKVEEQLIGGRIESDLFDSRDRRLAAAYRERASKVAYKEREVGPQKRVAAE